MLVSERVGQFFFDSGSGTERLEYTASASKLLMSGNEASAFAAIHAGCRFFAGYPITPSSEILHFLSEWLPKIGGSSLQTEDELAAIGAVIGASFTGVKSMTATSGPGLSLMAELMGLSSIAEVPAVTAESRAMAKELKRRGFRFVGPTTAYALMQACGLVNDHLAGCAAR